MLKQLQLEHEVLSGFADGKEMVPEELGITQKHSSDNKVEMRCDLHKVLL